MPFTLIIHPDLAWTNVIADLLKPVLPGPQICVANLAAARQELEDHGRMNCALIVASSTAPKYLDHSPPIGEDCLSADDIRGRHATPCIMLVAVNTGTVNLGSGENTRLLLLTDLSSQLAPLARSMVGGGQARVQKPPHDVDVDIQLTDGKCIWHVRGTPANPIETMGTIQISDKDMARLLTDSAPDELPNHRSVRQLGLDMYEGFMGDPRNGLEVALFRSLRRPNSIEAARFRFHVDQATSRLLVETLGKPSSQNENAEHEFWMLHTPIFRKFGSHGERQPLFKDRLSRITPVSCLIIEGDVKQFVALGKNFDPIPMAARETDWLTKYLTDNHKKFMVKPPRVMRAKDFPDGGYGDAVREVLSETSWQLIHYVGHSTLDGDKKGYLALGGADSRDLLGVEDFAGCARHAQFVFLNSCHSANEGFIRKLIEKNIPAVAGYAWPINDEVASVFAKHFYTNLFEGTVSKRFLEYSFMRAKKQLHDQFTDRPVWTSPILFMQMLNPEPDPEEFRHDLQ